MKRSETKAAGHKPFSHPYSGARQRYRCRAFLFNNQCNFSTQKPFVHFNLNTQTIYTHIKAGLLALVFVASWSVKTIHGLCMHHEHHDVPVCEAAHEGNVQHLHDERYTPEDCSVCAFIFAVPEIVCVPVFSPLPVPAEKRETTTLPSPYRPVYGDAVRLRGPPPAAA